MYCVFVSESGRAFVVRGLRDASSTDDPDGDDWELLEARAAGLFDSTAMCLAMARRRAWDTFDLSVEDAHQ